MGGVPLAGAGPAGAFANGELSGAHQDAIRTRRIRRIRRPQRPPGLDDIDPFDDAEVSATTVIRDSQDGAA